MPTLEVTVSIKQDGVPIVGSPFIRRVVVDESQQFATEQATGGGYATLPLTLLDQLSFLLLQPDQQITLRFSNQSDQGLVVNAGGLVLIADVTVNSGASTNATVNNTSGQTAVLTGLGAGT